MSGSPKSEWWKAGFAGACIYGLLGPGIVVALNCLFVSTRTSPFLDAVSGIPLFWLGALIQLGLPAFALGYGTGVLLKALSARCPTLKVLILPTAALGLAVGALPLGLLTVLSGATNLAWVMAVGAVAGLVCALLVLWWLHEIGLLHTHPRVSEMPPVRF